MTYLFGDSTPSELELDFLDFSRRAVTAAVKLLAVANRLAALRSEETGHVREADADVVRLEALGRALIGVLEPHVQDTAAGAPAACADAITEAASHQVGEAVRSIRAKLAAARGRLELEVRRERGLAARALEALLLVHPLPHARGEVQARLGADGRYRAELRMSSSSGISAALTLGIPSGHELARAVPVRSLSDHACVRVVESGGVLRRQPREVVKELARYLVAELIHHADATVVRLRRSANLEQPGFDLVFDADSAEPRAVQVEAAGGARHTLRVALEDAPALWALRTRLVAAAHDLAERRSGLVRVHLDGNPLASSADPAALATRLIRAMAPTLREIDRRGGMRDEYVLTAVHHDGRREQRSLAKAALRALVAQLPPARRVVFAPLGLFQTTARPGSLTAVETDLERARSAELG